MHTMHLTVITPTRRYHAVDGDLIVVPTKEGEEGYMHRHVPTIVSVVPGTLRYRIPGEPGAESDWRYIFVSAGYAEVSPEQVTVVTTAAEFAGRIDVDRAGRALERAKARIARPEATERDRVHGEHAIRRAKARIRAAEQYAGRPGAAEPKRWDMDDETP